MSFHLFFFLLVGSLHLTGSFLDLDQFQKVVSLRIIPLGGSHAYFPVFPLFDLSFCLFISDLEKLLSQGVKLGDFFNEEQQYLPDLPHYVWESIFLLLDDMQMIARAGCLCRLTRVVSLRILMSFAPKSIGRRLNRDVWELSQFLDAYTPSDPRRHVQMLHSSSSFISRWSSPSSLFGSAPLPLAVSSSSSSFTDCGPRVSVQDYYPSHPFWTQPLSRFRALLCGDNKKNGQMAEIRFLHGEQGRFYCLALDRNRRRLFQTASLSCVQCCTVMDKFFRVTHGDFVVVFKSIKQFDEGSVVDSTDEESGLDSVATSLSPPPPQQQQNLQTKTSSSSKQNIINNKENNTTSKKASFSGEEIYVLDSDTALEFGRLL